MTYFRSFEAFFELHSRATEEEKGKKWAFLANVKSFNEFITKELMKKVKTNWTKEELKVYTLIYCANADFYESKFEMDFIKSKIRTSNFGEIYDEFKKDNDYQSIKKIQLLIEEHGYTNDDMNALFEEIKDLFLSDDKYHILEKNLNRGLKRILNS
ncbi:hypothetical protein [Flavivirga sp. 57AJ16]|uniref:hypothetical protein n=1 Tax=Flavivirga sp. 57AJ16 TaxID=3025307 RepID=UPI00236520BB|nr:hypothetical protein [Flavivirga sp. 57AJ16]MDD7887325.1 hypothetical protein [Flavivirga sp. 57AJ16]